MLKVIAFRISMLAGLMSVAPVSAFAAMSFYTNDGAPTCNKIMEMMRNDNSKLSHKQEEKAEYERSRICDQRWGSKNYEPVWLGQEPKHSRIKSKECKALEASYRDIQKQRTFADNYECTTYQDATGIHECKNGATPPPDAEFIGLNPPSYVFSEDSLPEKSARILKRAVEINCFFY